MSSTIRLSAGSGQHDLSSPEWGYEATIGLGLHHERLKPLNYAIWDDGSANDPKRRCKCTFLLDSTHAGELIDLFTNDGEGRGVDASLILPSGSGFYPFGPDKGDAGTFSVHLLSIKPGGVQEEPFKWFAIEVEMIAVSYPSYVLPTQVSEGDFQIGTISALRFPPDWTKPEYLPAISGQTTRTGVVTDIDKLQAADRFEVTIPMVCNQSKAAALVNYLVGTARGANLNIIAGANTYLYGRKNGSSGTYASQMLNEIITVKHHRFDEFSFDLNFSYYQ